MKLVILFGMLAVNCAIADGSASTKGVASWYGEAHRGRLMANGQKFNPDKLTAASWFYPLGSRVRVTCLNPRRSVVVTITDRGPAKRLVRDGRVIDLSKGAFEQLAPAKVGLVGVTVAQLD